MGLAGTGEGSEGGGTSEVGSVARRATRRGGAGAGLRARARWDEPERRAARAGTATGDGEGDGASARTAEREATARLASEDPGADVVVGGRREASDQQARRAGAGGGARVGLSNPHRRGVGINQDARGSADSPLAGEGT